MMRHKTVRRGAVLDTIISRLDSIASRAISKPPLQTLITPATCKIGVSSQVEADLVHRQVFQKIPAGGAAKDGTVTRIRHVSLLILAIMESVGVVPGAAMAGIATILNRVTQTILVSQGIATTLALLLERG
jgi:hypothetical protein